MITNFTNYSIFLIPAKTYVASFKYTYFSILQISGHFWYLSFYLIRFCEYSLIFKTEEENNVKSYYKTKLHIEIKLFNDI